MKKLYWRPTQISRLALVCTAIVAALGLLAVEHYKRQVRQPYYDEKLRAARLAHKAVLTLRAERLARGIAIDRQLDPAGTGLIGEAISSITSNSGHLPAKQTATNPNFAAVVVNFLKQIGVKPGDVVAVGVSGSFPGLNIAVYAATQTLQLKTLVISSASASQFGANMEGFTWLEMEALLRQRGVMSIRSIAASPGGMDDRGYGLSKVGQQRISETISQLGIVALTAMNYRESIDQRLALYRQHAGQQPVRAYINVGGGTASAGPALSRSIFRPGVNRYPPAGMHAADSVMWRFVNQGVPVIHFSQVNKLAKRYGLPAEPQTMPPLGTGEIFARLEYNPWLVGAVLLLIFTMLYAAIRTPLANRFSRPLASDPGDEAGHTQQMI